MSDLAVCITKSYRVPWWNYLYLKVITVYSFYKNLKQEYSVLFLKVLFIIQDNFETCLSFSCQWLCIMITDKSFLKNFERKVTKNVLF